MEGSVRALGWLMGIRAVLSSIHAIWVFEKWSGVVWRGWGHEAVVSCPDDEDGASEGALLVGPGEQERRFGDGGDVLGEVAADLGVLRSGWIES